MNYANNALNYFSMSIRYFISITVCKFLQVSNRWFYKSRYDLINISPFSRYINLSTYIIVNLYYEKRSFYVNYYIGSKSTL